MHTPAPPFAHTSGPKDASVIVVGEAFGEQEQLLGRPFIGASGQELTRMLTQAGFKRSELLLTNVLAFRPKDNNIDNLCVKKADTGPTYGYPAIGQGKYLDPQYLSELDRLRDELSAHPRNLIIAMGRTASWALLGASGISAIRGTVAQSTLGLRIKTLPTFHPAAVLRQWSLRTIVIADLLKAKRESIFPEIRRPERWILVNPTLDEIVSWAIAHARKALYLAVDIETRNGQITEIGFASDKAHSLVIPFVKNYRDNYWSTEHEERQAWDLVEVLLQLDCDKIFQNGIYDLSYLLKAGLRVRRAYQDTMLLHHSLFPEMNKGLGFLGSLYTQEPAWKLAYRKSGKEETKADE